MRLETAGQRRPNLFAVAGFLYRCFLLLVFPVVLLGTSYAGSWNAFGPQTDQQTTTTPQAVTSSFSVHSTATTYTLVVTGTTNANPLIVLNGKTVVNQTNPNVTQTVTLSLSNTINVTVRGGVGSSVIVTISGVDNDLPTITASAKPAPNAAGWNNANVVVTFTCADKTSGVASCTSPVTVSTDGKGQVIKGTAVDLAGNTASTSVTINLDKTAPIITPAQTPAADSFGWNNTNVTVSFTCTDATSGVKSCTGPTTLSTQGANQAVKGTATDIAGNTATATDTVNIDKTAPTISSTATPAPNAAGWNNTNVAVAFTCADALSGVATCPPTDNVSTEGLNQTISGTAVDKAGNTANTSRTLSIDKTPPTITTTLSPVPNAAGWNNTSINATFSCTDNLSGVASCPAATSVTTEGANQSLPGTATDKAGNTSTPSTKVNIDKTPPTIAAALSPSANSFGWNNSSVTVSFTCADSLSGVANCASPVSLTHEGAGQTASGSATDVAGNSKGTSATVNIDETPPVITAAIAPLPNAAGWNNTNITATFSCTDSLSGVASCPAATTVTTEGANQSLPGIGTDKAGNSSTPSTKVNIDKTPPTIAAVLSPLANAFGWNNTSVTVNFTCADSLSGVANCASPVSFTHEGSGQAATGSASDVAGNSSNTSATVNIDETPPTITVAVAPAPNAAGWNNGNVTVTFNCADSLSGIAACAQQQSVTIEGTNQVTGTATDKAGNSASTSVNVNIDRTPPSVTPIISPSPNAAGWNNTNVTITFTCNDTGSGVALCPAPIQVNTEGANQVFSFTATDVAGNTATGSVTLSIDKTPPVITPTAAPAANANGWNNSPVTVTFQCSDALSGVANCASPQTVTADAANQTITGTATDIAGNTATASVTVSLETGQPSITVAGAPAANAAGWNNSPVTVTFQCTPDVAPITSCPQQQVVSGEGANQAFSGTVTDAAGKTASTSITLKIDLTPPTISASVSPAPNASGIVTSPSATVTFTCSDALSGVLTCPSPVMVTTNGPQNISGTAIDVAGNSASTTAQFTLQNFPPLQIVASASPAPNAAGWNNTPVTVSFTCSGGAPPVSCPAPRTLTADGANQIISGTATDANGTTATASVAVNLDQTPPLLTITSPTDGSTSPVANVTVNGLANDGLSGLATVSCNGSPAIVNGNSFSCALQITQGSLGITVTATDVAGNTTTSSITANLQGPKLTITSPAPLDLFSSSSITVTGTVDDPQAVINVNGVDAPINAGSFTANGVILREGNNLITATAKNAGGGVSTATVNVVLDTTPPTVRIDSPIDQAVVITPQIAVTGLVNDIVTGTVNAAQVSVTVNGVNADVGNRSFMASGVLLVPGQNVITAVAKDRAGNVSQSSVTVTLQDAATQQRILMISGNNQSGPVGSSLVQPLVVEVVNAIGQPVPNVPLVFAVAKSDGQISAFPQQGRQVTIQTDGNGQGAVNLQLGSRVGNGNNQVTVTSPGFVGQVMFASTATVGPPTQIHAISGESQKGVIGLALPEPLVAGVFDAGGNPIAGVPVIFTVQKGGGTIEGTNTVTKTTDSDGRVAAILQLAQEEGINNNVVSVSFAGLNGLPAAFTASGMTPGSPANTRVTGIVVDNAEQPIPNATASIQGTNLSVLTDNKGQFTINNAPIGSIVLFVDGATSTRPENFPFLEFPMVTVAGQDNNLGRPIYLPPLDNDNSKIVGGDEDVTLTMKGVPGVVYTVFAHSATFPDGSKVGRLTLSQVHADKVPMVPPNGTAPRLVGTLQPSRVKFDPPIRMQLPNTDGLAPGQVVEIFSFHHDLEQFVSEGTARVSEDGSVIVSDPGFGLTVSGWHGGGGPPPPPAPVCNCSDPSPCVTATCDSNNNCVKTRNIPPGQACHKVEITEQVKDHDQEDADYQDSSATNLYGGSIDKTSDFLKLKAKIDPDADATSFTWSVSGDASGPYTPGSDQEWVVGQIQTTTGQLNVHVDVQFSDGESGSADKQLEVGLRTDDINVLGWINEAGVPLSTSGVGSDVLRYFNPGGPDAMNVLQKGLSLGYLGVVSAGLPITPTVYEEAIAAGVGAIIHPPTFWTDAAIFALELALQKLFGINILLNQNEKLYVLNWQFRFAGNDCSVGRCPPDSFANNAAVEDTLNNHRDSYKLFNRLQIKFRVDGGNFKGGNPDAVLHHTAAIGVTHDPLFGIPVPGQPGPVNDAYAIKNSNTAHHVNEGSPASIAVAGFNSLANPLKWNDIGSRIAEGPGTQTGKQISVQVYPTYNIYSNGNQNDPQIPQAGQPIQNFNTNPYYVSSPNGPAPFLIPQ